MRGKLGILLGVLVFVTGVVSWSAPAMAADSATTLASFNDPRTAMPARPGHTIKRMRYGSSSSANFVVNASSQVYNSVRFDIAPPCTNCYITDMVPNLVYVGDANHPDGTTANLDTDSMLHHFVLINPGRADPVCPTGLEGQLGERFFAAGNERVQMHLPSPFGYLNATSHSAWRLISHIINKSTTVQKSFQIEVVFQYRTVSSAGAETKPLWLDIDGCGDSEYTTPVGYNDATVDWVSNVSGRMIGMAGHLHDVDITNQAPCTNHCPAKGHGIAVSAEIVGGNSSDYWGPIPPNNPPPAPLTGATLCRSESRYGTPWAGSRYRGHLDTMTECGVQEGALAPTYQQESWPPDGRYPSTGVPFSSGQTIRLHGEYQNDNPQAQTDVMAIMMSWYVPTSAGYPRSKGATPIRVPLVPAFNACTSPNRIHGPPDIPGNAANPDGSCNPPALTSSQLTVGTPDSNGAAVNSEGFVKVEALAGNTGTPADEADARFQVSMTDVRNKTGLADYTGQLQLDTTLRVIDKNNGPSEVGTVQDTQFRVTVPCATTASTTVGSTCSVNTTADAVLGGGSAILEGKRSLWQLGQVRVNDGGADGLASTTPNTLYAVQGIAVP